MNETKIFGLVGRKISYSFSKKYFEEKFTKLFLQNHHYKVFDIQNINEVTNVFQIPGLQGFNVTIPYKTEIISYLDELSEEAEKIGAVNTVLIKDGIKKGFNTDAFGFEKTLLIGLKPHHKNALILGDGGAAKAVRYVLDSYEISHQTVSRKGTLNFKNLSEELVADHQLIIQTTPVGTFPEVDNCLKFPFNALTKQHLAIDLIYNPDYTKFLSQCAASGAKTLNGFYMLEQQAEKAWKIWNY